MELVDFTKYIKFWSGVAFVGLLLAALGVYLFRHYSIEQSKQTALEINKRIEAASKASIEKINKQTDSIITNVGKTAEGIVSELNTKTEGAITAIDKLERDSKKAAERIQATVDKVDENAKILKNDLVSKQLILTVNYEITDKGDYEGLPENFCETFVSKYRYGLSILSNKVKADYDWKFGEFKQMPLGYGGTGNGYFHYLDAGEVSIGVRFTIYYEFELNGLIEGDLNDLLPDDKIAFNFLESDAYIWPRTSTSVNKYGNNRNYKTKIVQASITTKTIHKKLVDVTDSKEFFIGDNNLRTFTNLLKIIE